MHRLARANGLFSQFGASGSLLGPPVLAACVERFGWPAAAWCGALVTVPCVWLALRALARNEQDSVPAGRADAPIAR
jgi:MFS family permease